MTMTRRNTFKLGIATFLSSLAGNASAQNMNRTKVIVVGAGIAGLTAAKQLQSMGADVVVLEAGKYIGGRIRTDRSMGAPFEYGAGWIHGPSASNPIKKLASRVKARTFETDDDNLEVFDTQGQPLMGDDYDRLDSMYSRLVRKLETRVGRRDPRSLYKAIKKLEPEVLNDPMGRWMVSAFFEFDIGADIKNISAANAFSDKAFGGKDVIFTKGYDAILAPLVAGLVIRLNSRVKQIFYGQNGVIVDGMKADYVVCAVPLGVLKTGAITFKPTLPKDIQNAVKNIGFGTVTKIVLKFDLPFWDVGIQYFGIMTQPIGRWNYWLNYRTYSTQNILMGLSFGEYAPVADRMSKNAMTKDAMKVL